MVSWFIFKNFKSSRLPHNAIIVEKQLFLLIKNKDNNHLLLFHNVLLVVQEEKIIIKLCEQIHRFSYEKTPISSANKQALKFAKKQLRKIKKNEVYSLLPHEIFEKYQISQTLQLLKFMKCYKINFTVQPPITKKKS